MLIVAYAVISKSTCMCTQIIKTDRKYWSIDNDTHYSMSVPVEYASELPSKYFYNNRWWNRVYDYEETVDENGNPVIVMLDTFTDTPWSPNSVKEGE